MNLDSSGVIYPPITNDFPTAGDAVADHVSFQDPIVIYNKMTHKTADQPVFMVPHIGRQGLDEIGLTAAYIAQHNIPEHRFTDIHLEALVEQLAAISKITFVGLTKSRLVVNGAVPRFYAISRTTPDGVIIPRYSDEFAAQKINQNLRIYDAYHRTIDQQVGLGNRFLGSLDTFTPNSLDNDYGDKRDMAVSLIANSVGMEWAKALQAQLQIGLPEILSDLQSATKHHVNPERLVTINEPYGEREFHRLRALHHGKGKSSGPGSGITIEVRNDLLNHPTLVDKIAMVLRTALQDVYGVIPLAHTAHRGQGPARELTSPSSTANSTLHL